MTEDDIKQMLADREAGTPGRFVVYATVPQEGVDCWWLMGADGHVSVGTIDGSQSAPEKQANARRIARVPDLEAEVIRLRRTLVDTLCHPDLHDDHIVARIARAALKGQAND